jgi:predicted Zn-dependent protease
MLGVTHQWTIHHALAINPHDVSLFTIQPEQGNAITQKIRWVVLATAVSTGSVRSHYLVTCRETRLRRVLLQYTLREHGHATNCMRAVVFGLVHDLLHYGAVNP